MRSEASKDGIAFRLTARELHAALEALAERDRDIAAALAESGHPPERRRGAGFPVLLRIILAQQLSTKAVATIAGRLDAALGGEPWRPEAFMELEETDLRAIGLSRQKIAYGRGLAEQVVSGGFDPDALASLDDAEAVAAITALKGFGVWSAQMYLIFSLGRPDIWPVGDLGVREGVRRIRRLEARPDEAGTDRLGEAWRPHRSAVALLAWHVLHNTPA